MGAGALGEVKRAGRASLFVDSGGWIAVNDPRDRHSTAARSFYREKALGRYKWLFTTNLVVAESHAYLLKTVGRPYALKFLTLLEASNRVNLIHSTAEIENEARHLLGKYQDQDFSLCDAVSFAVMSEMGIRDAFAFDRHFEMAGFRRLP